MWWLCYIHHFNAHFSFDDFFFANDLLLAVYFIFRNGSPLQCSCLEKPMDGGAWWAAVHGVAKSRTRLSNFTFTFLFHPLEKEMATHSSVLAWRIPGTGEPGGLPSLRSHSQPQLKRLSSISRKSLRKSSSNFLQVYHFQWVMMQRQ